MSRLAILGASGHGKVVADIAELNGWGEIVFFDDAWPGRQHHSHWPIVGDTAALVAQLSAVDGVIVAIGCNVVRHTKLEQLRNAGALIVTLVHPHAVISRHSTLGAGGVVLPGVVVNAGARIGTGAILNTGCSVDHDSLLGDYVHVSPGARLASGVVVGDFTWVGMGACIRQMVHIGAHVMIGAGAVVVKPVSDRLTVFGIPARPYPFRD